MTTTNNPSSTTDSGRLLARLQEAVALHQRGQLAQASARYESILAEHPQQPDVLHLLGVIALQSGDATKAVGLIDRAVAASPGNPDYYLNLAVAQNALGRTAAALDCVERALALNPALINAQLNRALLLRALGRTSEAIASYEQVLAQRPDLAEGHFNLGNLLLESGRLEAAAARYLQALAIKPDLLAAHVNGGTALLRLGRPDAALVHFDKALAQHPDLVEALVGRGNALLALQQPQGAIASYDRALAQRPDLAPAHVGRANALLALKQPEAALAGCERALALQPDFAAAHNSRGNALRDLDRKEAALESYDRAIALQPNNAEALCNRGNVLRELGRAEAALASLQQAVALRPDLAMAYNSQASVWLELVRPAEALALCDRALALQPEMADAHRNRSDALFMLGRLEEAIASYDRVIALRPDDADAYHNRAVVLNRQRRVEEAAASYEQALARQPDYEFLAGDLMLLHLTLCDWRNFGSDLAQLKAGVAAGRAVTPCYPLMMLADEPALQRQVAEIWVSKRLRAHSELGPLPPRAPGAKIRLGYFSADFRQHPVSQLMASVFEGHDRERFEVIGFAFGSWADDLMRQRLEKAFDRLIDVTLMGDKQVAELARELGIDIAVDLGGYTQDNRASSIFAWRAAPVQASYIGFLGTMGAPWMDYLIADPVLIPPAQREHYSEKIVYLPWYQANNRKHYASDRVFSRAELGLPETGVVLASFNNQFKISPEVFESWMRILKAVPDSVLYLVVDAKPAKRNLLAEAEARGVRRKRIVFADRVSRGDYLARYRIADLFLDTWPCNAGTTASDALGMGVPLLTCQGRSFAARMAASVLQALDLPELITTSPEEYERRAVELARDPAQLAALRQKVEQQRQSAPLYDTARFIRHLENAFRTMHARYAAGQALDDIVIAP